MLCSFNHKCDAAERRHSTVQTRHSEIEKPFRTPIQIHLDQIKRKTIGMKKGLIATMIVAVSAIGFAMDTHDTSEETRSETPVGDRYTILNDTDEKVRIHTGYGETTLNPNGGRTSVTCDPGKKVKVDGEVIFEVASDMCGETVRLSDYL